TPRARRVPAGLIPLSLLGRRRLVGKGIGIPLRRRWPIGVLGLLLSLGLGRLERCRLLLLVGRGGRRCGGRRHRRGRRHLARVLFGRGRWCGRPDRSPACPLPPRQTPPHPTPLSTLPPS